MNKIYNSPLDNMIIISLQSIICYINSDYHINGIHFVIEQIILL